MTEATCLAMNCMISDQHEESLIKILRGHQSDEKKGHSETDITIAIAEHLLGKLCPGQSYLIDSRVKRKGKCRCGLKHCKSDPTFGSTGIGMYMFHKIGQHAVSNYDNSVLCTIVALNQFLAHKMS
jgi:hypothetical protein